MSASRFLACPVVLLALSSCAGPETFVDPDAELNEVFLDAADEFDVPRDLLVATAWTESRFGARPAEEASKEGGFGMMNLTGGEPGTDLHRAARLLDVEVETVMKDDAASIRGAAALLRMAADDWELDNDNEVDEWSEWFEVVVSRAPGDNSALHNSVAKQVFLTMESGLKTESPDGGFIIIPSQELDIPAMDLMRISGGTDTALASQFVGAHSSNYTNDSRGSGDIDMIVIHTIQGSYAGAISWFQNSSANATAHYAVRSSDGEITQMVREEDVAWHAGHWDTNSRSIGIEHEGYISQPETWYTEQMYQSTAALIIDLSDRYGIPKDRDHIIAHGEVPGCAYSGGGSSCHTDPGDGWDWDYLMDLVNGGSSGGGSSSGDGSTDGGGSSEGGGSTAANTGDLVGYVRAGDIYDTAAGISGATVALSDGSSTTTDSMGFYVFSGVTEGMIDLDVSASGYDSLEVEKQVAAGAQNWRSVALNVSSGGGSSSEGGSSSSGLPGMPTGSNPTGWTSITGTDRVTMSWSPTGEKSTGFDVLIYWYDGSDWQYYYEYESSDTSQTFWPYVDATYYAWKVRGTNGYGEGSYTDWNYFYFDQ